MHGAVASILRTFNFLYLLSSTKRLEFPITFEKSLIAVTFRYNKLTATKALVPLMRHCSKIN